VGCVGDRSPHERQLTGKITPALASPTISARTGPITAVTTCALGSLPTGPVHWRATMRSRVLAGLRSPVKGQLNPVGAYPVNDLLPTRSFFALRRNLMLLLYSGIPLGLLTIVGGASLLFATSYKMAGKIILGVGGAIIIFFLILILMAFISQF
jgi:hypothetical protein